jgi:curved DNA-binding protein CbpA
MAPEVDPFRTLGVPPGASLNELKSAYRRLAKQYHPDTAGERALPRFLAIQAAYERLVDDQGRLRAHGGDPWRGGASSSAASSGQRPRASRDAWRARRSTPGSAAGGAGAAGAAGSASGTRSTGQGSGSTRPSSGEPPPDGERPRHRRGPRKATPGSTTYDEAAEVGRDPEWDGGAWYGPSMGTFWTINPREYADPRKHGPEYLARARRAAGGAPDATPPGGTAGAATSARAAADAAEPATDADSAEGGWAWSGRSQTTTGGDSADWAARSWTFDARDAGPTWTPGPEPRRRPQDARHAAPPVTEAPPLPDLETLLRKASPANLLARARGGDRRWRLLIALVGWPPIAFAMGSLVLDSTGCSSYAASCPDGIRGPLVVAQLLVLAVLYLLPLASAVAAFASLAALAIALPVATILSVGSGPRAPATVSLLAFAVVATYLVAFGGAAWRLWRPARPPDPAP